jgi:hypothetical protein
VAKIKILVAVVQKNVIVIDADGLAKTRFVAHLAAYALRIGSRRKYEGGGQRASGSRHDRDCTHALTTLEKHSGSNRRHHGSCGRGVRPAAALAKSTCGRSCSATVTALTPSLSCRSCRPNAPFAELVCLSKSSVAEEYYAECSGNRWISE